MEENIRISTESIYRLILKDKVADGSLYRYLRHQGKKYRKRYGQNDYRGRIPNRLILLIDPYSGQSIAYRRSDRGGG